MAESEGLELPENVKDIGLGLDFIKKLTPIQFTKKQPKDYEESLKSKISGNLRDIEERKLKELELQEDKKINRN